ncbi:MAG: hypothetical protein N2202_05930 [Proteobacteria bacterium]|nr:hypothetical protein [Pseudomonadota bacterium]
MQEIRERIKVALICDKKGVFPVWFEWKGERIKVERVFYKWVEKRGQQVYQHYSVLSGNVLYHLVCHREYMEWFLEGIEG